MEALLDWEGEYHSYKPIAFTISPVTNQFAIGLSFQVDGIPSTVPFDNQVQKGYK